MVILSILVIVILLYVIGDVNYFLRTYLIIWIGRIFQRNYSLDETISMYGVCSTQDVGVSLRMRPSRMLRELDFARFNFWERTGVYRRSQDMGFGALQAATQLIIEEPVPLFAFFRIDTKLVYWDVKSFLMQHRLVLLPGGRTCALMTSRQHLIGACADTTAALGDPAVSPTCPDDVQAWMRAVEVTSARLRK